MSAPPFPNDYRCRQVSEADSKPCNICYKPSSTVLLASNKADHFFVCPSHLKDKSFALPEHSEAYTELIQEKSRLENEIRHANSVVEANRPYSWNKLMSNIGWSESVQPKAAAESGENTKDEENKKNEAKKSTAYEGYVAQANKLKKELADVNGSISGYQFKQFTLAKDVYRMRVNNLLQAKNRAANPQPAQTQRTSIVFPSVPKSGIS
ncbi:hypothetical protein OXX59_001695 [Metschnikowia pulcherrima]